MHKFTLLLILTSFLFANNANYSIIIEKPFDNVLFDVVQDYDRGLSAIGSIKMDSISSSREEKTYTNAFDYLSSLSNSYGSKIQLITLNKSADIVNDKTINISDFNEVSSIIKTPNNGYIIGGQTTDGLLLVAKLTSGGNVLLSKKIGHNNQNKMSRIISMRDGGFVVVGTSFSVRDKNINMYKGGVGLNDISVSRFSNNAQLLWSKKFGTLYDDVGVDAVEADDDSVIILGETKYEKYKNIMLMRISKSGDKIWSEHYKSQKNTTPYKIIKLRDGNFAISVSQEDEMHKEQIRLIKIDLQKNILLDKTIYTTYASALKDIKESLNSNIVGVGYVQDNHNTDGLAMLLDSKFTMLMQDHYGWDEHDSLNALTILHNSQIAAVGATTNKESQEKNMWILKLNSDLSLVQTSKKSSSFYLELLNLFDEEIKSNKLTIKEDLSITFMGKNLYFNVGEYELTAKQKIFLEKFSAKLLPFLEKNKQHVNTLEIIGHTSSEWSMQDFSNRYLKNSKLSLNRSFATLSHVFNSQDEKTKQWLYKIIKGSGLSFSQKVMLNEIEDKEKSRRVSFKIILN